MQFLSDFFGAIAKATLSVFIAVGLFGSTATSTNVQASISTTTPIQAINLNYQPAMQMIQILRVPPHPRQLRRRFLRREYSQEEVASTQEANQIPTSNDNSAQNGRSAAVSAIEESATLPTTNPNQPLVVPQESWNGSTCHAVGTLGEFHLQRQYLQLRAIAGGNERSASRDRVEQATTQYGTVWINNRFFRPRLKCL